MSYDIRTLDLFNKQVKRLAKKYPSLKSDLIKLGDQLQENPALGESLGSGFYKVRLKITSKRTGKSGGARVITFVKVINETVTLSYIYDKSERSTIADNELDDLLKLLGE